jgi:hypothetical protein
VQARVFFTLRTPTDRAKNVTAPRLTAATAKRLREAGLGKALAGTEADVGGDCGVSRVQVKNAQTIG